MEHPDKKPQSSDDVDLTQFFRWIGRGFNRAGHGLLFGLASLRNLFFTNRLFFFGTILIGLTLGVLYSLLLNKKYYQTTMVLSCDYLNNQIMETTIDKLNLLCSEPQREGLSELLHIDSATAHNILSFGYEPFVSEDDIVEMEVLREQLNNLTSQKKELVDKVMDKLTIVNKNAYLITMKIYNPDIVKPMEKALVSYFRENDYIARRIEINRKNLQARKDKLLRESRKLDSLKAVFYENYQNLGKTNRGSGNVYLGDEKLADPLAIFKQDLELNQELLQIEQDLHVGPDFEIVDGFTGFKQPESASLFKILFIAFWLSFIMGYIIIGAWRLDQLLASYQTRQ